MTQSSDERQWVVVAFTFAAISGLLLQARGALLPSFQETFLVSESQLGLIAPVGSVGYFLSSLLVGMTMGKVDVKRLFLLSVGGSAVALVLLSGSPTFVFLVAFVGLRMVTEGIGRALDRPILSHLYSSNRSRIFGLYDMAWAVGATTGPIVVTVVLAVGDWRHTYLVAAVLLAVLFVQVWRLDLPSSVQNEQSMSLSDLRTLLRHPTILTMTGALLFAVAVEGGIFTWLPYYANQFLPRSTANLMLSAYLVAYIPGRYLASRFAARVGELNLVFICSVVGMAALGGVLTARTMVPLALAVFALGLCVAAAFPTMIAWGTDATPDYSGPVNALANTAATAGIFISPAIIGFLADAYDITVGMQFLLVVMAGLAVLTGGVSLSGRTERSNSS